MQKCCHLYTFCSKNHKILGHYVEFVPHPKSLNGKFKPSHEELAHSGFTDIHTALANTVENLQISTMGETYSKKDVDKLLATAKNEVSKRDGHYERHNHHQNKDLHGEDC